MLGGRARSSRSGEKASVEDYDSLGEQRYSNESGKKESKEARQNSVE